jgi:hypothetical protein
MFLQPVDAVELGNTILQLKNKSPGWDGICADPVKAACDCLVEPLLHIVNLSFIHGTFPDDLKVAQVVPLYKKGSPMELGNYRPISLLPLFSKVFEKLIHKRIMKFVEDNSILSPHQFGFQSGKNTSMALISAVHKIVEVLEEGHVALGVLLDFQKAFDTVQHNILLRKLNKYGIRGAPLDLITSYLSGRHQRVLYNGTLSEYKLVTCGVPQGSVLGPLLFLLYINDVTNVSPILHFVLFADDTNVFIYNSDEHVAASIMNHELKKLSLWFRANRLMLNTSKTNFIAFSTRRKLSSDIALLIDDVPIKRVESAVFLGVILDEKLRWNFHIQRVRNKISRTIGIFSKLNQIFPRRVLITLYYSLVFPNLTYGIEVWGAAADVYIKPLFLLQKKIVRIITLSHYRAHSDPIFTELKIAKFNDIYTEKVILFMFKLVNNRLPLIFNNIFFYNQNRVYDTRTVHPFKVPRYHLNVSRRTLHYKGVILWNSFHHLFCTNVTVSTFQKQIKNLISVLVL